jgi:hypothetical protein
MCIYVITQIGSSPLFLLFEFFSFIHSFFFVLHL